MCLNTRMTLNPKFKPNKKNGGIPPICTDERIKYIPISCGNCIECRKKKARDWRVRLLEEYRTDQSGQFVTLTFAEDKLRAAEIKAETREANQVATVAIRDFLERWRKKYKKSVKHWFITELGHKNTERLHIHGIIYTDKTAEEIEERWQNGKVDVGYSMNEKTINYVIKYVTKVDKDHKGFTGKILTSPGLGKDYLKKKTYYNRFIGEKTEDNIKLDNGTIMQMPTYYRNKIYTEEQREIMWKAKIDKNEAYVMGQKIRNINTPKGKWELHKALEYAREVSMKRGYGDGSGKKEYMTKNGIKKFGNNDNNSYVCKRNKDEIETTIQPNINF